MRPGWDLTPGKARLVLAALVACAAALALRWAFLVPIFQSPDEPEHFDYALCIAQNGGLLKAPRHEHPTVKRHPYSFLLLERTRADEIAGDPSARVPADYGTATYFAAIDRAAPPWEACRLSGPPGMAALYPFGYYAVLAAWLEGVRLVHGDGPAGLLIGGRLFSVLLLVLSLLFSYGAAREMGARRRTALLLVGCIGCFPMVSFVGSYVQPDNLAFTLASLCFFLAPRLNRRPGRLGLAALLGLALGLLLVTKVHFFLCVLAPVLLLLAGRWLTDRPGIARMLGCLALLGLPSAVLGLVHFRLTRHADQYFGAAAPYTGFVRFYLEGFIKALKDFYFRNTHLSFWGVFGWMDTPLVIGSAGLTKVVRFVVLLAVWLVLALTLVRLGQVATRLTRAARRGHWRRAVQIAGGNVPVNSYFLFTALMIALFIRLDNRFGAQGRNWLPFMLPIFWTALVYAPRALRAPAPRRLLGGGLAAGLVLYATAGSYFALETIKDRYYVTPRVLARAERHPAVVRRPLPGGEPGAVLVTRELSINRNPGSQTRRLGPSWKQQLATLPLVEPQRFSFLCPFDSLRGVEVMLHSANSSPRGTVTLEVQDKDGLFLCSSTVRTCCLRDNGLQWFPLHGVSGVKGKPLRIQLVYTPAPGAGGVVVTFTDPKDTNRINARLVGD